MISSDSIHFDWAVKSILLDNFQNFYQSVIYYKINIKFNAKGRLILEEEIMDKIENSRDICQEIYAKSAYYQFKDWEQLSKLILTERKLRKQALKRR